MRFGTPQRFVCRQYSKSEPGDPIPFYALGRIHELEGNITQAIERFEYAAQAPTYFFADFRLWGVYKFLRNKPKEAQAMLQRYEEKLPKLTKGDEQVKWILKHVLADEFLFDAGYYDRRGDADNAIRALQMGLTVVPSNLRTRYLQLIRPKLEDQRIIAWIDQQHR